MLFIFWCIVVLLMHSEGKTIILGLVVMAAVVISQICAYAMSYLGYAAAEEFKLLFLAMFVWLMLESAKKKHVF
jgi:hypothetical protein